MKVTLHFLSTWNIFLLYNLRLLYSLSAYIYLVKKNIRNMFSSRKLGLLANVLKEAMVWIKAMTSSSVWKVLASLVSEQLAIKFCYSIPIKNIIYYVKI